MSRIAQRFTELQTQGRKALITYITAGDPTPQATVSLLQTLVRAGADILEIGVPFSDPMAEGPVIQRAMERALLHNVSLQQVLAMVSTFRQQDKKTPIVLMGYLNPIEVMGYAQFVNAAIAAGVDGVLIVDMPPEEAEELLVLSRAAKLDMIFLVAPTSSDARIKIIAQASSGFVYYVSLKGVTGAGHLDTQEVQQRVKHIKTFAAIPVGVGFGIKDAASAKQVADVADAVVVGSALVKLIEANQHNQLAMAAALSELVTSMRMAMDAKIAPAYATGA